MGRSAYLVAMVFAVLCACVGPATARTLPAAPGCGWTDAGLKAREMRAADAVWQHNVQAAYGVVRPSRAYSGVWLRDSFWTLTALGDVRVSSRALVHFAAALRPSGQVPTQFKTWLVHPLYFNDESTLLFLIWSDWTRRHGGAAPPSAVLAQALKYARAHVRHGRYQTPAGPYTSWFDSFRFPTSGTLSYNQGLLVVALEAAQDLRLGVGQAEVRAAAAGYRSLVTRHGGYLPLSDHLAYHDISGLAGEFLSTWLFGRTILSDDVVRNTLETQPRFGSGFRVVTATDGRYLPPSDFIGRWRGGDYHNGASWLLFDYLGLAAGSVHHVAGMGRGMRDRMAQEFASGDTFHEYLNTFPGRRSYGAEPRIRDQFSWNSFVVVVDERLRASCQARMAQI
jgi:hypothetical protein